jgi:hypothetical protein
LGATELRRDRLIGVSMVAAPALLFIGNALHPVNHKTNESEWLAGIAGHRAQWYVAHLVIFVGLPLFVPAVVGLVGLVRGRASGLAEVGAALTIAGLLGTEAFVTVEGFVAWEMTSTGAGRGEMVALLGRFNEHAATSIPVGLATLLFDIGLAVVAIALLRDRVVPTALAGSFLLSRVVVAVALVVGDATGEYQQAAIAFGDALLVLALGGIGVRCFAGRPRVSTAR